jgi:hypothetical protein
MPSLVGVVCSVWRSEEAASPREVQGKNDFDCINPNCSKLAKETSQQLAAVFFDLGC